MKFITATAAGALLLLSASPAFCFGSIEPTGSSIVGTINFNAHGCLDQMAYEMLNSRPEFSGASFPTIEWIKDNEGVNVSLQGHGPDAKGATDFSEHYYNPVLNGGEGKAPGSVGKWFLTLAQGMVKPEGATYKPKAAAWSAHFLADLSVPFHVNGIYGRDLEKSYPPGPHQFYPLPETVTGPSDILAHPIVSDYGHQPFFLGVANYLAAAKGDNKLDWYDPWYWNGDPGTTSVLSSHIAWEGKIKRCPSRLPYYSSLWPGNPTPSWHQNTEQMRDVVVAFAKAIATNTRNHVKEFINDSDEAELQAAESIATMWRASFSALRVKMTYDVDPASGSGTPAIKVHGIVQNFAKETPSGVQLRLVRSKGSCTVVEQGNDSVKILGDLPPGAPHQFGDWRVTVPVADDCVLTIGAIGRYKTPDLQFAINVTKVKITVPNETCGKGPFSCGKVKPAVVHTNQQPLRQCSQLDGDSPNATDCYWAK